MAAAEPGRRIIVKKKGGGHGHHGGAWKVAYADFVTAMMALFMVMWLLASTDSASRKEISQYFRTGILPDGDLAMNRAAQLRPSVIEESSMPAAKHESIEAENAARQLNSAIEQMVKGDPELAALAAQVSVSITEDGVLIEAIDRDGQSMLFDTASSALKPGLVAFLQKLAPLLAERKNKIQVMGHTDARPFVSRADKTNWDLSYERATNARKVLESGGLGRDQIISVDARGASQLRNPKDPFGAENRRLAILVLKQEPPGPPEQEAKGEAATPPAPETAAATARPETATPPAATEAAGSAAPAAATAPVAPTTAGAARAPASP